MEIGGSYEGFYEYGPGYTLPEFGKRVKIWVEITENEGILTGSVSEEETEFSIHHPAKIEGRIEDQVIYFIKKYTPETIDFSGILDSESWNQSDFEPVDHAGYIDHENNCLYGDWFIEAYLIGEDGKKESEPHIFKGIWFLSRTGNLK